MLQFGTFFAVGGTEEETVDVRLISATNRELRVQGAGTFRLDLFYRIATLELAIPPLRERADDILPLFRAIAASRGITLPRLAPDAEQALLLHPFPGNVRELEGLVERLYLHCAAHGLQVVSGSLVEETLGRPATGPRPPARPPATELPSQGRPPETGGMREQVESMERRMIEDAIWANAANLSKAARALGVSRQGLRNKMARYGISRDAPR